MDPTPVGVDDDLAIGRSAAASGGALGPAELWVRLSLLGTGLLGCGNSQEGEKSQRVHV